LVS
ncbi:hypothetical protein THAOC_13267, partial [Thalassiosira oceanica]|jgi:hypothetical protein